MLTHGEHVHHGLLTRGALMRARGLPAGAVCVAGMKSRSLPLTVLGIREPEIKFLARGFFVRRDPQPYAW